MTLFRGDLYDPNDPGKTWFGILIRLGLLVFLAVLIYRVLLPVIP